MTKFKSVGAEKIKPALTPQTVRGVPHSAASNIVEVDVQKLDLFRCSNCRYVP